MKALVCGGRLYDNKFAVYRTMDMLHAENAVTELICGGAKGADSLGYDWAHENKIPTRVFFADWAKDGRSAGPIRNLKMLNIGKPDVVVAFPGGKGTAHMVKIALTAGIRVIQMTLDSTVKA
jgi:hypothetical protein